ncbi:MAG: hypothetical protein K8S16_01445, partial [Bacteroidales bacterium]|nr:hypothetical protein [Bacteroidales bacterium]
MKKDILLIFMIFGIATSLVNTAMADNLDINISAPDTISPGSDANINILLNSQNVTRGFSLLLNIPEAWNVSTWNTTGLGNPGNVIYQQAPEYLWLDDQIAYSWT